LLNIYAWLLVSTYKVVIRPCENHINTGTLSGCAHIGIPKCLQSKNL